MTMLRRGALALVMVGASGCHSRSQPAGGEIHTPAGSADPAKPATTGAEAEGHLRAMYREEATLAGSKRVDAETADNVAMALRDCKVDEPTFVACLGTVHDVRDLEANCLIPLDDEGSEADGLVTK